MSEPVYKGCLSSLRDVDGWAVEWCLTHDQSMVDCVKARTEREVSDVSEEMPEPDMFAFDWLKPLVFEVEFQDVDPESLGILTGGVMGTPPAPTFSLDVTVPARRRTFWEWLRRRPRHLATRYFIPNARLAQEEGDR